MAKTILQEWSKDEKEILSIIETEEEGGGVFGLSYCHCKKILKNEVKSPGIFCHVDNFLF